MNERSMQKLIAAHAYWSDRRRELRQEGFDELMKCPGIETVELGLFAGESCIDRVVDATKTANAENCGEDDFRFDDIWSEMVADGEVCEHCQRVRELKSQRVYASRRLGNIRGAITRVGRNLQEELEGADAD